MRALDLLLALAGLAMVAGGARGEVTVTPQGEAMQAPPKVEQPTPQVLGGILLIPQAPPVVIPQEPLSLPDPGALARKARRRAECLRLSKGDSGTCLGRHGR